MKRFFWSYCLLIMLFACTEEDAGTPVVFDPSYFPLHVGDSWEYHPSNEEYPEMNDLLPVITRTITATKEIDGLEYHEMVVDYDYSANSEPRPGFSFTLYFRVGEDGFVHEYDPVTRETTNVYRLGAAAGDDWTVKRSDYPEGLIKVSATDVRLNNETVIADCKRYAYDVELMADEERASTLALGLGVVAEDGAWGYSVKLKRAVINGHEHNF